MQQSETIIAEIKKRFESQVLPGRDAMLQMAPPHREKLIKMHSKTPEMASVLLLIYPKKGQLYFPLIVRPSTNMNDRHRGQIALPGGKFEAEDKDGWHCAIRETHEELGVETNKIEFIGALTSNFIPVCNFRVNPYVGFSSSTPVFRRQEDEVALILEIPLLELLNPAIVKCGKITLASGIHLQNIPYFLLCEKKVWGATAMMLNEFVALFASNPLP